jgi:hypothetical protein
MRTTVRDAAECPLHKCRPDSLLRPRYVRLDLALQDEEREQIIGVVEGAYVSRQTSGTASSWDAARKEIVRIALEQHLFPLMSKQALEKKKKEALDRLRAELTSRVELLIDVAPPHILFDKHKLLFELDRPLTSEAESQLWRQEVADRFLDGLLNRVQMQVCYAAAM